MTVALSSDSVTVPLTALPTAVMLMVSSSGSESLVSKVDAVMSMLLPSATVAVSSTVTGASLTGVTVTPTVAVSAADTVADGVCEAA